ncbi:MAG: S8 family serine peptidase [Bacteroidota bacterium]
MNISKFSSRWFPIQHLSVWGYAWLILLSVQQVQGQTRWIFFPDKGPDVQAQILHPENYLSAEAVQRRLRLGIPVQSSDVPVYQGYLDQIQAAGWDIVARSKWLNGVLVRPVWMQEEVVCQEQLPGTILAEAPFDPTQYGRAQVQNDFLNIQALHERDVWGQKVRVAVLDAGFNGVDTIPAFDSLRFGGRLLGTFDFVDRDQNVFHGSSHGTKVLSTMCAWAPEQMIGTAPKASYYLLRTEVASKEPIEEQARFMEAMEWADSAGVDLIHASLGYNYFDDSTGNYTYADMDGKTAIPTIAADKAASKGILVTVSAGNEGNNAWRRILTPCDADSALCIGSIDSRRNLSRFSSIGPTSDGRIKPDIVAMGSRSTVVLGSGRVASGSGTSYSAPQVAGLMACLIQLHPKRGVMDLIRAVRLSGDRAAEPDTLFGYGLPDGGKADSLLRTGEDLEALLEAARAPVIEPLPPPNSSDSVQWTLNNDALIVLGEEELPILDYRLEHEGRQVHLHPRQVDQEEIQLEISLEALLPGTYELYVRTRAGEQKIEFRRR